MRRLPVFLLFIHCLTQAQLSTVINSWKNDKDLHGASIGFCILNTKTGELVAELNRHEQMVPASTLKVITTSAALSLLGRDFRFETQLIHTGIFNRQTGVLEGDLIIKGSGDPSLQSENFSPESVCDVWAKKLQELGLKEIKGKIIGDASCQERAIPGEWIWADISNYFGSTPCGLSFMDNKFRLIYNSGETGSEAKLVGSTPIYKSQAYQLSSSVTAMGSKDEAYAYGDPFSFKKEIKGTIPAHKTNYEVEVALPDPALLCAEALSASLEKTGIKCTGGATSIYTTDPRKAPGKLLHTHYSPPLEKLIYYTNLKSINFYCESLLRTIGKGDSKKGIESVKKFCSERGLDSGELFMVDGSGLSRANSVTPGFIASLLAKIARDSLLKDALAGSFPVAGRSGGMSAIGKGTFIENNMKAKTGYIQRARAYCGYVTGRSGKALCFSVIFNNYNCSAREAKIKLEKFLVALGEL